MKNNYTPASWENISKMRKPLIAAVNGFALGRLDDFTTHFHF